MTSLTFILSVLPLMLATGAGAGARNSVGTTAVGGMVAWWHRPSCLCCSSHCFTCSSGRWRLDDERPKTVTKWKEAFMLRRSLAAGLVAVLAVCVSAAPAAAQDTTLPRVEFDEAIAQALAKNPSVATAATGIVRAEALL